MYGGKKSISLKQQQNMAVKLHTLVYWDSVYPCGFFSSLSDLPLFCFCFLNAQGFSIRGDYKFLLLLFLFTV